MREGQHVRNSHDFYMKMDLNPEFPYKIKIYFIFPVADWRRVYASVGGAKQHSQ